MDRGGGGRGEHADPAVVEATRLTRGAPRGSVWLLKYSKQICTGRYGGCRCRQRAIQTMPSGPSGCLCILSTLPVLRPPGARGAWPFSLPSRRACAYRSVRPSMARQATPPIPRHSHPDHPHPPPQRPGGGGHSAQAARPPCRGHQRPPARERTRPSPPPGVVAGRSPRLGDGAAAQPRPVRLRQRRWPPPRAGTGVAARPPPGECGIGRFLSPCRRAAVRHVCSPLRVPRLPPRATPLGGGRAAQGRRTDLVFGVGPVRASASYTMDDQHGGPLVSFPLLRNRERLRSRAPQTRRCPHFPSAGERSSWPHRRAGPTGRHCDRRQRRVHHAWWGGTRVGGNPLPPPLKPCPPTRPPPPILF